MQLRASPPAKPEFNQARLAAEAAFSLAPPQRDAPFKTVVIVKRRKAMVADTERELQARPDAIETNAEPLKETVDEVRPPRVFRVALPIVDVPSSPSGSAHVTGVAASVPGIEVSVDAEATRPVSRRRRTVRSSQVTITRPSVVSVTSNESLEVTPQAGDEAPDSQLDADAGAGELKVPHLRPVLPFEFPKLLSRIKQLERQAQRLKQVESARAVRWIRKAMADHGLEARDLGL